MTTTSEPVRWDRTLIRGTDHAWTVRKVDQAGTPLIPTSAAAQIRQYFGGPLWLELDCTVDPVDGWVTVSIPKLDTETAEWDDRVRGIWDLEVLAAGATTRWVQGTVEISQDVTRSLP